MGCFFSFYAFDNATVYAFNNGVRWVRALKCLFLQCFGGEPRTSYSRGCAKYRAWSWGTMPKMRLFKAHFCSLHMACASGLDRVWNRFLLQCAKMPRTAGKMVFYIVGVKFATWRSKSGFRKKRPKYISGAAPIIIFMFFGVAPRFGKKRCFQNGRNFAETTENVVPNCRGRKTQFWHPRVRNGLSWSG